MWVCPGHFYCPFICLKYKAHFRLSTGWVVKVLDWSACWKDAWWSSPWGKWMVGGGAAWCEDNTGLDQLTPLMSAQVDTMACHAWCHRPGHCTTDTMCPATSAVSCIMPTLYGHTAPAVSVYYHTDVDIIRIMFQLVRQQKLSITSSRRIFVVMSMG